MSVLSKSRPVSRDPPGRAAVSASQPTTSSIGVTMPSDCTTAPIQPIQPTREIAADRPRSGLSVPRGLLAGTVVAVALVWGPYLIIPGSSRLSALVQSRVYLRLLTLTIRTHLP